MKRCALLFLLVPALIAAQLPVAELGCTSAGACNYNPEATENDGSCVWNDSIESGFRYIHEVFDEVEVTEGIEYGVNITVLPSLQAQPPTAEPLLLDLYQPAGDSSESRPLLLFFHRGNFLPPYVNNEPYGTRSDSAAVALCRAFARRGYVVASVDYRLGWNPLAATQAERTKQLLQAMYRGMQDCRTAIRYFRKSEAEEGNPYGINPDQIALMGDGTGGMITLMSASIEDYTDLILDDQGIPIPKFWFDPGDGSMLPMALEDSLGNIDATSEGYLVTEDGPVQLCIANHIGYSSDAHFQVNLGGAIGDLNWLDEGDTPMVSFQCPHDQFLPYTTGVVIVPTTNEPVVELSGAFDIHEALSDLGNNASFSAADLIDPGEEAGNNGMDGLYPILNNYIDGSPTEPFDASPWNWFEVGAVQAYDNANGTNLAPLALTLNPTMGPEEAALWLDVITNYTAPRMALGLGLASTAVVGTPCNDNNPFTVGDLWQDGCTCAGIPVEDTLGCTDPDACNFDETAMEDDGSCIAPSCDYPDACNYDPDAVCGGAPCIPSGCMDAVACNFNPDAQCEGSPCLYNCCPGPGCCADGTMWDIELEQCVGQSSPCDTVFLAIPSCGTGTVWDPMAGECIVAIPTDTDFDGCVAAGDLLNLLGSFGSCPPIPEWPDADLDVACITWSCGDPLVYQGDIYATVLIGGQCWFAENLRADTFQNGENIPVATPDNPLHTMGMSARVAYAYDNARVDSLGWLYNGFVAIDDREACPAGWSVPTDEDFKDLERHLGMPEDEVQGTSFRGSDEAFALKSSSVDEPGWNGTNITGFSAIPSGVHYDSFSGVESSVQFWCRDGLGFNSDNYYRTFTAGGRIYRSTHNISDGHTIRCLKD